MQGSSSNDWTLVTVTYNSARHLRESWSGIDLTGVQWLVVDNNSSDDSVAIARELGAQARALDVNLGFSKANNLALATVDTPWVMFVNPDVMVDPTSLERLAHSAAAHQSLIAPQLKSSDGSLQPNARGLPFLADKVAHRGIALPGSHLDEYIRTDLLGPTHVAWVMGAAVGGATAHLKELGGWSEDYFLYYEDHDLGIRSWLNGSAVIVDPAATWRHGWERATMRPNLAAWKSEVRSMRAFYRNYDYLLTRSRFERSGQLLDLRSRLWTPAA